ncbi:UNVERIFIED_CONTAM: hypothetical protein GTU68_023223 [Idotea baltica]|nr:hypothetical protein [Idotea baltica]
MLLFTEMTFCIEIRLQPLMQLQLLSV